MLLAEKDGRAVGAHAFVRQADEAIWLSMATLDEGDGVSRSAPLLWAAMRRARALGCVGYDLAGVPLADPADPGEAGRFRFKASFAPHKRVLLPMQVAAVKPVSHAVLFSAREAYRGWKRRRSAAA
jgi:lipid II:glycine glycyltransferase (peptidoglycan interpeptide bridge formation enzyme)